jgi:zinc transport system ATP-binding protein
MDDAPSSPLGSTRTGQPRHGHPHDHATCGHDHHGHGPSQPLETDPKVLVSARNITVVKSGRTILSGIDIDLRRGEIVTVIGPNGAGKTTLVRAVLGVQPVTSGAIVRKSGLVIGYVPQRFDSDPAIPLTVARFLTLGITAKPAACEEALAEVGASAVRDRQLSQVSGGELQRVLLARAVLRSPDLLVLDEPARGVDHIGEAELYGLIARLRDTRGFGVLLVSHDLHLVMANADRVVCINRHVCCQGKPEAVAAHPEYARLFGAEAARAFAVYTHHHDHDHDALTGLPVERSKRAYPDA